MGGDWIKEALKRQTARAGRTCKPARAAAELAAAGTASPASAATVHYPKGVKVAIFGPDAYSKSAGAWAFLSGEERAEAMGLWKAGEALEPLAAYLARHYPRNGA